MSSTTRVIVGVDGSEPATTALDWAIAYAQSNRSTLCLVTAVAVPARMMAYTSFPLPDLREAAIENAKHVLERAMARCVELAPDVDVVGDLVDETPIRALLRASAGSELLVVGCRGLTPMMGAMLGSVSTAVSAHAPCPVVVVRGSQLAGKDAPVVVGIDGSERDDATLAAAFEEAAGRNASLVVVHAWSDVPIMSILGAAMGEWPTWVELRAEAIAMVERQLTGWRAKYPAVMVRVQVVHDQPAVRLLEFARTAGLVVVGSHGRGGFNGMHLGSVARRLVHHADCPVLVIRHPVQTVPAIQEELRAPAMA